MKLAALGVWLVACAPHTSSVTIAPASTSASRAAAPSAACPRDLPSAMTATCTAGQICRYPETVCVCHMVPYCPGGAVREGPTPPPESLELECMHPDCEHAAAGAPCATAGLECRGPACYSRLTCTAGRWSLVQLGPPP